MNRVLAALALGGFLAALVLIAIGTGSGDDGSATPTTSRPTTRATTTRPTTTAAPPKVRVVKLGAVGAYDPEGDGHENDDLAPLAVDGDPATFWKTEHYTRGFFKDGVGLVLDAGKPQKLSRVTVATDAGGSTAQIRVGTNPNGPFRAVSPERPLDGTTAFKLKDGTAGRYVVVWITGMPEATGEGHVTEVKAFL